MEHDHIVQLHEIYHDASHFYIVQELLEGGDLHNFLRVRDLKEDLCIPEKIVRQIAR